MILFVAGLFIGTALGAFIVALLAAYDYDEERTEAYVKGHRDGREYEVAKRWTQR